MRSEENKYMGTEIAVIGMNGRFPKSNNCEEYWELIKHGNHGITFYTDEELKSAGVDDKIINNPTFVKAHAKLHNIEYFDSKFFEYSPKESLVMEPQIRILHECVWGALEDSGYASEVENKKIGLYTGAASTFNWEAYNLLTGASVDLGAMEVQNLTNKDFLALRIGYKLGFRGPCITLHTACSTSLVAIHMASRAVLTGECEMAIAGAISISSSPNYGYFYQQGSISSSDGYCRPFDAKSDGCISGEGVGVVVLKSLNAAIRDNDNIHAVIKGSAINNDGHRKVGYSAPSVKGQVEVIKTAIKLAKIEPNTVGYIEAHGTGTSLGDPIEFEALRIAYGSKEIGHCAIGSIKSLIGHLDAAAGIAGFIKAILVLKNKQIPPNLYFTKPNPQINLTNSQFYINNKSVKWSKNNYPRRCGVSSFGMGGTNAHIIIEEYCNNYHQVEDKAPSLLTFSAKSKESLNNYRNKFLEFLTNNKNKALKDIEFSLNKGRKTFEYKTYITCDSIDEAIKEIETNNEYRVYQSSEKKSGGSVIFMFAGIGSQYPNMGLELYENELVYRKEIEECHEIIAMNSDINIIDLLYPKNNNKQSESLDSFQNAQLSIFVTEYALARLLISWGIIPDAMIGYSLGEYVAAVVSNVISLEEMLKLIIFRGELIEKLPDSKMLSIPLCRQEVIPLLTENTSVAIDNGTSCIISGISEEIKDIENKLKAKRIISLVVKNSKAIHSPVIECICQEFIDGIKKFTFKSPDIPYISNVSGSWINDSEIKDSSYWATHLKSTVEFDKGIKKLINQTNPTFIEIGPGQELKSLLHKYNDKKNPIWLVNILKPESIKMNPTKYLINKIGHLWGIGIPIKWENYYKNSNCSTISLPTYCFDKTKYKSNVDLMMTANELLKSSLFLKNNNDIRNWTYIPSWKRSIKLNSNIIMNSSFLIFENEKDSFSKLIVDYLERSEQEIIKVNISNKFSNICKHTYTINPTSENDFQELVSSIHKKGGFPDNIIYLWNVSNNNNSIIDRIHETLNLGYHSILYLAKAIGTQKIVKKIRLSLFSNNMFEVIGDDLKFAEKRVCIGPLRTIPIEYPNVYCQNIDVDYFHSNGIFCDKLLNNIFQDVINEKRERVIAYRNEFRMVECFDQIKYPSIINKTGISSMNKNYLVTGGLGGIGLLMVEYLIDNYKGSTIVILSRTKLPEKNLWNNWLKTHSNEDKISLTIRKILEFEKKGNTIHIFSVDVSNRIELIKVLNHIEKLGIKINGVIHNAGIADGNMIQLRTREHSDVLFSSKIFGTVELCNHYKEAALDFFIISSSLSSYISALGQVGYCSANSFLDAYAQIMFKKYNMNICSINWEAWRNIGIAIQGAETLRQLKGEEFDMGITAQEGINVFNNIINSALFPQVLVSSNDFLEVFENENMSTDDNFRVETGVHMPNTINSVKPSLSNAYVPPENDIQKELVSLWERLFGFEIGIFDDFFELGGDSLKAITLTAKINEKLDAKLPVTYIFTNSNIKNISQFIDNSKTVSSDILVLKTKGNKRLFCFPPAISYGICYKPFTNFLVDYSIYSFNFIEAENRLEQYVKMVTSTQKEGPYILFGYSGGGNIAIEVANKLEEEGYNVSDLILMDSYRTQKQIIDKSDQALFLEDLKNNVELNNQIKLYKLESHKEELYNKMTCYNRYIMELGIPKMINANVHMIVSTELINNGDIHDLKTDDKMINLRKYVNKSFIDYNGFGMHNEMLTGKFLEKNINIVKEILDKINT